MPIIPPFSPTVIPTGSLTLDKFANIGGYTLLGNAVGGANPPSALDQASILTTLFERGADLGDANVTIQPFTDRASLYVMPPNTMTANRAITLGNTGFYATAGMYLWCAIFRRDTTAFTLRINNAAGAQIYLDPANPAAQRMLVFACDAAGAWLANQYIWHIQLP